MKGYAPGWQVRCLKCGLKVPAGQAGVIRIGAIGKSYKLGWCSRCRRLRCLVIERSKDQQGPGDSETPQEDAGEHGQTG